MKKYPKICLLALTIVVFVSCVKEEEGPGKSKEEETPREAPRRDSLMSFCFPELYNTNLYSNVKFTIDQQTLTATARITYYAGLRSMVATFSVPDGTKVYVDGEEQTSGVSVQNFNRPVSYVVVDEYDNSRTYTVSVDHFTGLPVLLINTPQGRDITDKINWIDSTRIHLDGVGIYEDYDSADDDPDCIRGRGNATWNRFDKKSYNLKLGKKASLLGMPEGKRWCLMANYRDRIKIRNDIAFYVANGMGSMGWNCHGEFVELILNGKHRGIYEIVEQIRIGKDRVDITEFETDENGNYTGLNDSTITGGYLFLIDAYFDETYKFRSTLLNLPVEFKQPNENVTQEMMAYAQSQFNGLEAALYRYDYKTVYEMIDRDSFIDFGILNDLLENDDAANRHSDYVHKDRGGKLVAGPVWDFDSFTWRSGDKHFKMRNSIWYPYLLKDKAFCRRMKERWLGYKNFILTIPDYVERRCSSIERSESYDATMWFPIVGVANKFGDESMSYRDAIERVKTNFKTRFNNMNSYIMNAESAAVYDSEAE